MSNTLIRDVLSIKRREYPGERFPAREQMLSDPSEQELMRTCSALNITEIQANYQVYRIMEVREYLKSSTILIEDTNMYGLDFGVMFYTPSVAATLMNEIILPELREIVKGTKLFFMVGAVEDLTDEGFSDYEIILGFGFPHK